MNIEDLITLLRTEIEYVCKCYSPDLPQNDENCCAISIGQGNNIRSLNKNILYSNIPADILIRGTTNDKDTRKIADNIFNQLDMKKNLKLNDTKVILIECRTPNYAFRDENQRIYYNIDFNIQVQWGTE